MLVMCMLVCVYGNEQASTRSSSVASISRSFMVHGPDRGANLMLAIRAEDLKSRIERILRIALSIDPVQPISVHLHENEIGMLQMLQGYSGGFFVQRLFIDPEADYQDFIEGLCQLLLNRYAVSIQDRESRRAEPASVPAWLASGLSIYLYSDMRDIYRERVREYTRDSTIASVEQVLQLDRTLLPLEENERICSFILVNALFSQRRHTAVIERLIERSARGEQFTAQDLITTMEEINDARDLAMFWQTSIAALSDGRVVFAGLSAGQALERIEECLKDIPAEYVSFIPIEDIDPESLEDFISYRGRPWTADLQVRMRLELSMILMEQASAQLRELGSGYNLFFRELSLTEPSWSGFGSRRLCSKGMLRLLDELEKKAQDIRGQLAAQRLLVRNFEEKLMHHELPVVEDKHRAYLDQVEKTLEKE